MAVCAREAAVLRYDLGKRAVIRCLSGAGIRSLDADVAPADPIAPGLSHMGSSGQMWKIISTEAVGRLLANLPHDFSGLGSVHFCVNLGHRGRCVAKNYPGHFDSELFAKQCRGVVP